MVRNQPDTAAELGFKPGSKAHKAVAMYLKPSGSTDAAVREACGGPQRNLLNRVTEAGHTVTKTKVDGPKGRLVTAYRIELKK